MKLIKQTGALLFTLLAFCASGFSQQKPNILFIIADDASLHFGQSYRCPWVKTPNIDRLALSGLVFDNAYTPTAKCAPSRAAILTGRNPWQLEEAANHVPHFPVKFKAFSEALSEAGVNVGNQGKVWGPGSALTADGKNRSFGFRQTAVGKNNPGKGFEEMLKQRTAGVPFFYWFGSHHPHRSYKQDSGIQSGKRIGEIDRVPGFWPDNETVRKDMLDYALVMETFDAEVGELLQVLDASGEATNTLVIVTSDNGMPFPRSKGHTYDISARLPLVASWPAGIAKPGRRVTEFVSFIDLAPTFLELLNVDGAKAGMSPVTGRSFAGLLRAEPDPSRRSVILGRERNDVLARTGTPSGLGYPSRALREGDWFYIHNFAPDRWPCGNPERGMRDTDASPTKTFISQLGQDDHFWQMSFGKRPQDELFDLAKDPDCINNLAGKVEYAPKLNALRETLFDALKKQDDPRVLGKGDVFDNYRSPAEEKHSSKQKKEKKSE